MSSSTDATTSLVQSEYKYGFYTGHRDGIRTAGKLSWFLLPAARPEKSRRKRSPQKETGESSLPAIELFARRTDRRRLGEGEKWE